MVDCCDNLTDIYNNRPAAGNACDIFFPSDGFCLNYDSGASWLSWSTFFPLVVPPTTGWSWVNQGTATISETKDACYMYVASAVAWNLRLRVRSMPTPPYTLTAVFLMAWIEQHDSMGGGLCLRDSTSGRLTTWDVRFNASNNCEIFHERWVDPNNRNATVNSERINPDRRIGLRIEDDNQNLTFYYSKNMQNWISFSSEARTTWLESPDQIGFFGSPEREHFGLTLISWEVG